MGDAWATLSEAVDEVVALEGASGVLGWDQQVMMPPKAAESRGKQLAVLSRLIHERATDPKVGAALGDLEKAPTDDPVRKGTIRVFRRSYDRATKVDTRLVMDLAMAQSSAFEAWVQAKRNNDFNAFAPHLERLLDLTKRRVAAIDPHSHPYDVLLDEFDPGTTVASLRTMFARLRDELTLLIKAIGARPQLPDLEGQWDVQNQRLLHDDLLRALGYDLKAGRLDDAEHPFTVGMHPGDVRITTHFYPDDLLTGIGSTVHECGHALYEQGLPSQLAGGALMAKAASFGLHESQSRFWENAIGRSGPFSNWLSGRIGARFGDAPSGDALFRASNRVEPGLIRIRADEVTYNLHIIVRFEVELAMLEGKVAVKDIPDLWNEKYKAYLGITPPSFTEGVLQDVHWSSGAFGYFPSYTLGNLYAASFLRTMQKDLPDLWTRVEAGDFAPILGWLREKVHTRGHLEEAPEIVRSIVGDRDLVGDMVDYLWARHGKLYGAVRG